MRRILAWLALHSLAWIAARINVTLPFGIQKAEEGNLALAARTQRALQGKTKIKEVSEIKTAHCFFSCFPSIFLPPLPT